MTHYFISRVLLFCLVVTASCIGLINIRIYTSVRCYITPAVHVQLPVPYKPYAIVLGASVHGHVLSNALLDRMQLAVRLYQTQSVGTLLLTGDGTGFHYNETEAMLAFALSNAVPKEHILIDEEGYNTSASITQAYTRFHIKNAYVISQDFHLARAVWMGRVLGMDLEGLGSGDMQQVWYYRFRELFAKTKDFFVFFLEGRVFPFPSRES